MNDVYEYECVCYCYVLLVCVLAVWRVCAAWRACPTFVVESVGAAYHKRNLIDCDRIGAGDRPGPEVRLVLLTSLRPLPWASTGFCPGSAVVRP